MFQPIMLASFGVMPSFEDEPSTLILDGIDPLTIGGHQLPFALIFASPG
jgi:hypothetical protein